MLARQYLAGRLAGLVEGVAGGELGLDVFEIQPDMRGITRLYLGQYLGDRLYMSLDVPLVRLAESAAERAPHLEGALEYEVGRGLLLRVERTLASRFGIVWEITY